MRYARHADERFIHDSRCLESRVQLSTDKMAEKIYINGRKWQLKNLHMSKKSSTFVSSKDKKYISN